MRHRQLATTNLEEGGPSGDALQGARVDTASPLSLYNPQVFATGHRGGGEGAGVAITGLRVDGEDGLGGGRLNDLPS